MDLLAESNSSHKDTQQPPFRFTVTRGKVSLSLVSASKLATSPWARPILSVTITRWSWWAMAYQPARRRRLSILIRHIRPYRCMRPDRFRARFAQHGATEDVVTN
jgi:hypothetical protein